MSTLFETMTQFFKEDNWTFQQVEGKPMLSMHSTGENGSFASFAEAHEKKQIFIFYTYAPVKAPESKRLPVALLLTRMNYALMLGNWELDFEDGEVRYKTSIDVEGDRLSVALVKNVVIPNLLMVDRYTPAIMAVIYGNKQPLEALQEIDGK
jgi:hypothetical protein